jgi:predicted alpha/beta superfamily hydrolase
MSSCQLFKWINCCICICLLVSCSGPEESLPKVSSGRIERLANFNSQYVSARHIDIWLPEGYNSTNRYAVWYMHDGQMLFDSTITWNKQEWKADECFSRLISKGLIDPVIVVGIWNGGKTRHSDYFPQKPFYSLPASFRKQLIDQEGKSDGRSLLGAGALSDNYLRFITEELKPFIDSNYHVLTDKSNTYIAGSSMGGLISMYAMCEYPDIFGKAACISTHWSGIFTTENNPIPEALIRYLKDKLPDSDDHKIYFDYGTGTLDSLYEVYQTEADRVMEEKGFIGKNRKTLRFEGSDHSERSWSERLHLPVLFLMTKD